MVAQINESRNRYDLEKKVKQVMKTMDTQNNFSKTVLIVEDNYYNMVAMTSILKSRKINCQFATNGQECLDILSGHPNITLVLMDMLMPVLDGYKTIETIRKTEKLKDIPIIAVTAFAMKGDKEKCIEAGATDYISKPVDVDELLLLLKKY